MVYNGLAVTALHISLFGAHWKKKHQVAVEFKDKQTKPLILICIKILLKKEINIT